MDTKKQKILHFFKNKYYNQVSLLSNPLFSIFIYAWSHLNIVECFLAMQRKKKRPVYKFMIKAVFKI